MQTREASRTGRAIVLRLGVTKRAGQGHRADWQNFGHGEHRRRHTQSLRLKGARDY
jgi:hypothetical protein